MTVFHSATLRTFFFAIHARAKELSTSWLFFLYTMDFCHYPSKHSKRVIKKLTLQTLIRSLLQEKHLVITQEKDERVMMALS